MRVSRWIALWLALALAIIAGVLDTGSLADMRRQVAEGTDPGLVAGQWLDAHPLGVGN